MHKILLVEDELDVLNAMVEIVEWNQFGFETPVACPDGREAIKILESGFSPVVIISDIYMPFVDGLELAAYSREHFPEIIVVFLSGYTDFKYAQKALQLKVHDYVLKPVTPKNMHSLLEKLAEKLQSDSENKRDSEEIMKTHFLNQLLSLQMDSSTINEGLVENHVTFPKKMNTVAVLDVDLAKPADISARKNLELMRYGLLNVVRELAEGLEDSSFFLGNDGLITGFFGADTQKDCLLHAEDFCKIVIKTFRDTMNLTVSCGIGVPTKELGLLYHCHSQGVEALSLRFYTGKNSILVHKLKENYKMQDVEYAHYEDELLSSVKNFDEPATVSVIEKLCVDLKKQRPDTNKCISHCHKLMTVLVKLTREIVGKSEIQILEEYWDSVNFYSVFSLSQLEEIMLALCRKAFLHLDLIRKNPATLQMIRAEQFIVENYSDSNLSLNTITEHLAVSTSYFSTNFKARTGATFVEYLTRTRMERAKEILSMTNLRTYEVASDVGYSDPQYFSSAFKKAVGISPKEYRETHADLEDKA